jgi:hypothetical protein
MWQSGGSLIHSLRRRQELESPEGSDRNVLCLQLAQCGGRERKRTNLIATTRLQGLFSWWLPLKCKQLPLSLAPLLIQPPQNLLLELQPPPTLALLLLLPFVSPCPVVAALLRH